MDEHKTKKLLNDMSKWINETERNSHESHIKNNRLQTSISIRNKYTDYAWIALHSENFKILAEILKDEEVLEINAGTGIIGFYLNNKYNTNIHITTLKDDPWYERVMSDLGIDDLENLDAISAINKYPDKKTILSIWPPYADNFMVDVLRDLKDRRLVLVSEGDGGCVSSGEFWDELYNNSDKYIIKENHNWVQYNGLNDFVMIIERKNGK